MGHVRESKLTLLVVLIIVIIVIAVLVFRERFKTLEERGRNLELFYLWVGTAIAVLIAVVVTTAYLLEGWTSSKSKEYGFGEKIRGHYENTVDNMKARSKEKQRIRIAQQHGLQH